MPKVPHLYQLLPFMIGLEFNLTLTFLLVEQEIEKCLEVKGLHLRMIHQYPVHPKNHQLGGHQKQTLLN